MGFGALAASLLACVGCGMGFVDWLGGVQRRVGVWLQGVGELEWRGSGEWTAVEAADAARRLWGPQDAFLRPRWTPVAPGLDLGEVDLRRRPAADGFDLLVARIDPKAWRFRVVGAEGWAELSVADHARAAGLALAVNASYFSDEGPIGLVVSDGVRRHRASKRWAAHFLVDAPGAVPRIVNRKGADTTGVDQGFQGFPAIMTDHRTYPYMRAGGRGFDVHRAERRTAGCVTSRGEVLLVVTDSLADGLSFDELATVMGGLGCEDAMAFDGGSSTAFHLEVEGHRRSVPGFARVQVVLGISPR